MSSESETRKIFSREGAAFHKENLLKTQKRMMEAGAEAGDEASGSTDSWHDNFGYEEAMRRVEMESARLRKEADEMVSIEVIEVIEQSTKASIGCTIVIENTSDGNTKEITIGAWGESLPEEGLVSYQTPLAKALIGKKEGDLVGIKRFGSKESNQEEFIITKIHPASYKYRKLISILFNTNDS